MVASGPNTYPRLVDLPKTDADRFLALDCAGLFAPLGPIPLPNVIHQDFAGLTRTVLERVAPTAVIMPLFAGDQDALSMIEALEDMRFAGPILVIAPHLPRPALVERELRAAGPGDRLLLVSP